MTAWQQSHVITVYIETNTTAVSNKNCTKLFHIFQKLLIVQENAPHYLKILFDIVHWMFNKNTKKSYLQTPCNVTSVPPFSSACRCLKLQASSVVQLLKHVRHLSSTSSAKVRNEWSYPSFYISFNNLLQQVIEWKIKGRIEVTARWGRRCRKLLDDLKVGRGYWYLKKEAVDHTVWRARFGRGFGPVMSETAKWMIPLFPHIPSWEGLNLPVPYHTCPLRLT
jgi:hypothetical protein